MAAVNDGDLGIKLKDDVHAKLKDINLTCGICKRTYEHPRVLDCLHSFCEECIINNAVKNDSNDEKHVSDDGKQHHHGIDDCDDAKLNTSITCMECDETTDIPEENTAMLPYNFFANNAIDFLLIQCKSNDNDVICTNCDDDSTAMSRCFDCSEFLCESCVTAHKRLRLTKEHKIIALDTLRENQRSVHRPVYCPDHDPEIFTFFCEVCKDLICKECTILNHRGHKYESKYDLINLILVFQKCVLL